MPKTRLTLTLILAPVIVAGCGLLDLIGPLDRTTTVRLVNDTPFPVDVQLFYHDVQEAPRLLITTDGTELNEQVAAGDTFSLTRNCDDLQAVLIDDADLRIIGGIGPEDDTDVLRDGDDFGCGDIITFTFNSTAIGTEFEITTSVN